MRLTPQRLILGVIATLKAKEGSEADLLAALKKLAELVRANESGCLQYDPFVAKDDPATIVMMERYASEDDLAAHGQTPYFKEAGKGMAGFLAGRPDVQVLIAG